MRKAHVNAELIHLPVHASWLNPAELFFSIVQRKALTPNDLGSLAELARRLMDFGRHYRNIVRVDVHSQQARPSPGEDRVPARAARAGRLNTATLADTSTSSPGVREPWRRCSS
ncbi:MAG: hypothetical protein H0W96_06760 [Solirubrobacterales bacterium]|nr:hypothetical protein [Solirubrobacterales bacterium]